MAVLWRALRATFRIGCYLLKGFLLAEALEPGGLHAQLDHGAEHLPSPKSHRQPHKYHTSGMRRLQSHSLSLLDYCQSGQVFSANTVSSQVGNGALAPQWHLGPQPCLFFCSSSSPCEPCPSTGSTWSCHHASTQLQVAQEEGLSL